MRSCRRVAGVLVIAMLFVSGCGTRVPAEQVAEQAPGADGLGVSDLPRSDRPGAGTDLDAGVDSPKAGTSRTDGTGSATSGPGSGPSLGAPLDDKRGPLRVGIIYNDAGASSAALAGIGAGFELEDTKGIYSLLIKHINSHGGFGGRKLVPVWYGQGNEGSNSEDVVYQGQCDFFTQDHKVPLVIIGGNNRSLVLQSCLAKRGVVAIHNYSTFYDDGVFTRLAPFLYSPSLLSGTRLNKWIDGMAEIGYFNSNAKLGIVTFDTEMHRRVTTRTVQPAMARHGVSNPEVVYISGSSSDLGNVSSQSSSAVLRFRSSGVTHVIFVGSSGVIPFFFVPAARSQNYHPRYGWNTHEFPQYHGERYPEEMRGSVGMGWDPFRDVLEPQAPPLNSAATECIRLLRSGGYFKSRNRTTQIAAVYSCDALFFLRAAMRQSGGVFDPRSFRKAVTALRGTYVAPLAFRTQFGTGRFDGASELRPLRWNERCRCFEYFGKRVNVG